MDENEIRQRIARYKFYHTIPLTPTLSTPGNAGHEPAQNLCMHYLNSLDLKGKRLLDIGCRDGIFCFAAESRGAAEIIGIDNDLSIAATEFLIPFFNSKVTMQQMNLYSLTPESLGIFDIVIFAGVLYHLRYPFWGLKAIRDVMKIGGHLIIETAIWKGESHNALLYCPVGNESPYEPTSCTFFNEKGLVDTLLSLGFKMLSLEYLSRPAAGITLKDRIARVLESFATTAWDRPKISAKEITRCVAHCEFRGYETDSFLTRYWEKIHDFHTREGG